MPDSVATETLFVRLYLDRHIKKQLAIDLPERGFDVLTTEEAGLDTAPPRQFQFSIFLKNLLTCHGESG